MGARFSGHLSDLGSRIVHSLSPSGKKRDTGWSCAVVVVIGPLIGGGLAGCSFDLRISSAREEAAPA